MGPLGRALDVLGDNFLALLAGFMPEASSKVDLHDPITIATLVEPDLATFETRPLSAYGPAGECRTEVSPTGGPSSAWSRSTANAWPRCWCGSSPEAERRDSSVSGTDVVVVGRIVVRSGLPPLLSLVHD